MPAWRPTASLKVLLAWSAATFIIFWLPAVRGLMDGASYEWGSFGFSGAGTAGDYWFPVFCSALAVGFLALGYRGGRMPFPLLLVAWHGLLAVGATLASIRSPESFRFRGDTLGVDVSLAWVGPVLFGGFFLLALYWVARQRPSGPVELPAWGPRNRRLAGIVIAMLPLQFLLLRFGEPHGTTDQIGVLLTMAQWALISAALYPWRSAVRVRSASSPPDIAAAAAAAGNG